MGLAILLALLLMLVVVLGLPALVVALVARGTNAALNRKRRQHSPTETQPQPPPPAEWRPAPPAPLQPPPTATSPVDANWPAPPATGPPTPAWLPPPPRPEPARKRVPVVVWAVLYGFLVLLAMQACSALALAEDTDLPNSVIEIYRCEMVDDGEALIEATFETSRGYEVDPEKFATRRTLLVNFEVTFEDKRVLASSTTTLNRDGGRASLDNPFSPGTTLTVVADRILTRPVWPADAEISCRVRSASAELAAWPGARDGDPRLSQNTN